VEICLRGQPERVLDADDADLLAVGADQAHLGNSDALVDAWLADRYSSCRRLLPPHTRKALGAGAHGGPRSRSGGRGSPARATSADRSTPALSSPCAGAREPVAPRCERPPLAPWSQHRAPPRPSCRVLAPRTSPVGRGPE